MLAWCFVLFHRRILHRESLSNEKMISPTCNIFTLKMMIVLGMAGGTVAMNACPITGSHGRHGHARLSKDRSLQLATQDVWSESDDSEPVPCAPIPTLVPDEETEVAIDYTQLEMDLNAVFTTSRAEWPADFGNYGPFFVRLAWHCAGSFRESDGRGGCDGSRIRFDPENQWPVCLFVSLLLQG